MNAPTDIKLTDRIRAQLLKPVYFRDILDANRDQPYRTILRAWSEIRNRHELRRDEFGRYWLEG